jgi:hypothetical protein
MQHAVFALFLLPGAHALLEIQIEGSHGWAQNLPPAASTTAGPASVGEPADLLSPIAQAFLFVCVHASFGLGLSPSRSAAEIRMLGFVVLFWVLEGLLWFVCNPSYGLRRFNMQSISWRRDSCGHSFPALTDRLVHGREDAQTQQVLS